ncbi:hypothetical protein G6549_24345 [Bacillus sp. MM2020_1]|nr:hypothetical protein [Bacillus sp. MM2020_1]
MNKKLFFIKLLHTIIWAFYVLIIFYISYAGVYNKVTSFTWIAIGLVIIEGIILMLFKGKCPLTIMGNRYTDNHEVGFDIFLPRCLAKYNKMIFTSIYVIGVLTVVYRL